MGLDVVTLQIAVGCGAFIATGVLFATCRYHPRVRGAAEWTMALGLLGAGLILLALRGRADDMVTLVVGNICILAAEWFFTTGNLRYAGRRTLPPWSLVVIAVASGAFFWRYSIVEPDTMLRVVVVSGAVAVFAAMAAYALRGVHSAYPLVVRMIIGLNVAVAAAHALRAGLAWVHRTAAGGLAVFGPYNEITQLLSLLVVMIFAYCYMQLIWAQTNEELKRRASVDPLTGVFNRRGFESMCAPALEQCAARGQTAVLMVMDLDHFKKVNDAFGHQAGDSVLSTFAGLCQNSLRTVDLFGRYGGEEFVALLPGTDVAEAGNVAARLRMALARAPLRCGGTQVPVTVSIGLAQTLEGERTLDDLFRRADAALYESKKQGRNRVVVAGGADSQLAALGHDAPA